VTPQFGVLLTIVIDDTSQGLGKVAKAKAKTNENIYGTGITYDHHLQLLT